MLHHNGTCHSITVVQAAHVLWRSAGRSVWGNL